MVGQTEFFVYTDDRMNSFALRRDVSNMQAINSVATIAPAGTPTAPCNLIPRTANYLEVGGLGRSYTFTVLAPGNIATLPNEFVLAELPGTPTVRNTGYTGESLQRQVT